MARLLIVDDEQSICWALAELAQSGGHEVRTASSAERGLEIALDEPPDVVVMDIRLPGMDGLTAIEHLRAQLGGVPIIVITAHGDLETAVQAVRQDAFEYILKPFDLDQMQRAIDHALLARRDDAASVQPPDVETGLVGHSPVMQEVFKRIALAANSEACVLLTGESGTGKELVARAIHRFSDRAEAPFVAVNVASLSISLAESELFGHERGAFTGADAQRAGLLAQADGGTLFLDEVADIPLPVQVKLLRALDHGEVTPVGANHAVPTRFRVISATHQDLLQAIGDGSFRHDLYFRLCAFQIAIPPLRNRKDDIVELARHFLSLSGRHSPSALPEQTVRELRQRRWSGNVRELRNAMEHAVIVSRGGRILPEHLPAPLTAPWLDSADSDSHIDGRVIEIIRQWAESRFPEDLSEGRLYEELLRLVEPPLLRTAMQRHQGQCNTAARSLGLHRTTLRKKLDDYGIE